MRILSGSDTGVNKAFARGERRGEVDGIDVIELDLSYANTDGFIKRTRTFLRYVLSGFRLIFTQERPSICHKHTAYRWYTWDRGKMVEKQTICIRSERFMAGITQRDGRHHQSANPWFNVHPRMGQVINRPHVIALSPGIAKGLRGERSKQKHLADTKWM